MKSDEVPMMTAAERLKNIDFLNSVSKLSAYWPDLVIKHYVEKNRNSIDPIVMAALNCFRSIIAFSEINFTISNLKYEVCFNGRSYNGYDQFDPVGYTWYDLIPEDQMILVDQYAKECALNKKPVSYTVRINDLTKTESVYLATVIWPLIENNEVIGYVTQSSDITDQKTAETRLIGASQMAAMGEVLGAIVHEINTPLSIIQGAATLLQLNATTNSLKENTQKLVGKIVKASEKADLTVKTIKNLFRPDGSNGTEFSLKEAFNEIRGLYSEKFKNSNVELKILIPDEDTAVPGDINNFTHCLLNLTNNAFDAINTVENSWVKIESRIKGDLLEILVSDSGIMNEELRAKVFKTSFTTKPRGKGTGIGLNLCNRIINDMKGRIYLDPESKNTTFVIELPIKTS